MTKRDGMDVLVVGGGRMGTALGSLLAKQGARVTLWVRRKKLADEINANHTNNTYLPAMPIAAGLRATTDLESAVKATPIVLMAVPSQSFRDVARQVGDFIEGDQILLHTTKGFEVNTFKRMSQILREETCTLKLGVLSGPTFAGELAAGHPSGVLLASLFDEVIVETQRLFMDSRLRVYGGHDVIGTEVAGAFKNIVAVAAGAVDGLEFGSSTKWLIVTRGLSEMGRLGVAMGGKVLTFGGLAGIGDLGATCASPLSLNLQLGRHLAEGKESLDKILKKFSNALEAIPTAKAVHQYSSTLGLELPIANAIYGLLHEGWTVQRALDNLLSIPVGWELAALG